MMQTQLFTDRHIYIDGELGEGVTYKWEKTTIVDIKERS